MRRQMKKRLKSNKPPFYHCKECAEIPKHIFDALGTDHVMRVSSFDVIRTQILDAKRTYNL